MCSSLLKFQWSGKVGKSGFLGVEIGRDQPLVCDVMPQATSPKPAPHDLGNEHWEFVRELLNDLEREEEDRERLAYFFGQWRLSIKAFRRVEEQQMVLREPSEQDLLLHKACVTALISHGSLLLALAKNHDAEAMAGHGADIEVISAIMRDLHNTFDEWHGQANEQKLNKLSSLIFDASPELNLRDSRV